MQRQAARGLRRLVRRRRDLFDKIHLPAFSNASALTAVSENVSAADLAWAKELLPVVLSWLV